jgi:hypothetical protein
MINIAKLLKNCPKGTKLYSPIIGEVEFVEVINTSSMPIRVEGQGFRLSFDTYGRYMGNEYPDSECLLFPSKDCRTWEGWKTPVEPKFKVGSWIVHTDGSSDTPIQVYGLKNDRYLVTNVLGSKGELMINRQDEWHLWTIQDAKDGDVLVTTKIRSCPFIYRKTCYDDGYAYYYAGIDGGGDLSIACPRKIQELYMGLIEDAIPATKEQRDFLFAKMKEAGYEWDDEKKELKKIINPNFKVGDDIETGNTIETIAEVDHATCRYYCESGRTISFKNQDLWHLAPKPHYDIANFHVGMPVLVRDGDCGEWRYILFSHYRRRGTPFAAGGQFWFQCIPFNEDTKHLVGTTDMPSEEYINW